MQESDGAAGTQPETGDNRAKVMCAAFVDRRRANYSQTMLKLRVGMEKLEVQTGSHMSVECAGALWRPGRAMLLLLPGL